MKRAFRAMSSTIPTRSQKARLSTLSSVSPENLPFAPAKQAALKPVGDLRFFQSLKDEEHRLYPNKKHHHRDRLDFSDNYSAALALPYEDNILQTALSDQEELFRLSQEHILEHANRRVDLFFYTLIAYYNTKTPPTNGHTTLQHGKGRHVDGDVLVTEACHSSFTPSLLDVTIFNYTGPNQFKSILCGTHFMDSLNATMELPSFVNKFDDVLEAIARPKCFNILQNVAVGNINPVQGLNIFLKMMSDMLNTLKNQGTGSALTAHSALALNNVNSKLIDLVIKGTLSIAYCDENQESSEEYIQQMLRLTGKEKGLCRRSDKLKEQLYSGKFSEIQQLILTTNSSRFALEDEEMSLVDKPR